MLILLVDPHNMHKQLPKDLIYAFQKICQIIVKLPKLEHLDRIPKLSKGMDIWYPLG